MQCKIHNLLFFMLIISMALLSSGCGGGGGEVASTGGSGVIPPLASSGLGKVEGTVVSDAISLMIGINRAPIQIASAIVYVEEHPELTAITDDTGNFVIENIPAGQVHIIAERTINNQKFRMQSSLVTVQNNFASNVPAINVVTAASTVTGTIIDAETLQPLADVDFTVWGKNYKSDASGKYTIPELPSGNWDVTFSRNGYLASTAQLLFSTNAMAQSLLLHGDSTSRVGPKLQSIYTEQITATSATIVWKSDVESSGFVQYGENQNLTKTTNFAAGYKKTQMIPLTGLKPSTKYDFKITAMDEPGNQHQTTFWSFTTLSEISNVSLQNVDISLSGDMSQPSTIYDLSTAKMVATYSNNATTDLPITWVLVSGKGILSGSLYATTKEFETALFRAESYLGGIKYTKEFTLSVSNTIPEETLLAISLDPASSTVSENSILSLGGLKVTAHFSNGSTEVLSGGFNWTKISGPGSLTGLDFLAVGGTGTTILQVKYNFFGVERSTNFTLTIVDQTHGPTLSSLSLSSNSLTVNSGTVASLATQTASATYSDGSIVDVTGSLNWTVLSGDATVSGQNLQVNQPGFLLVRGFFLEGNYIRTVDLNVTVQAAANRSLSSITATPTLLNLDINATLNLSTIVVTAHYTDNSYDVLDFTQLHWALSGSGTLTNTQYLAPPSATTDNLSVTYQEEATVKTFTIALQVIEPVIFTELSVNPTMATTITGTNFDINNVVVSAIYSNGSSKVLTMDEVDWILLSGAGTFENLVYEAPLMAEVATFEASTIEAGILKTAAVQLTVESVRPIAIVSSLLVEEEFTAGDTILIDYQLLDTDSTSLTVTLGYDDNSDPTDGFTPFSDATAITLAPGNHQYNWDTTGLTTENSWFVVQVNDDLPTLQYQSSTAPLWQYISVTLSVSEVPVTGATFTMGRPNPTFLAAEITTNPNSTPGTLPTSEVMLSDYYIGRFEVTQGEYAQFLNSIRTEIEIECGYNLVKYRGLYIADGFQKCTGNTGKIVIVDGNTNNPVVVSWNGAALYCNWLSENQGLEKCYNEIDWTCAPSKDGYRLPTEAEWEFAARGGTLSNNFIYSGSNNLLDLMDPTNNSIHQIGMYLANELGIFDMTANANEWCDDLGNFANHRIVKGGFSVNSFNYIPSYFYYEFTNYGNWETHSSDIIYRTGIRIARNGVSHAPQNYLPVVQITAPIALNSYTSGVPNDFSGLAADTEDGWLTNSQLQWTSSMNGPIGTGENFSTDALLLGTHLITLTATDGDGGVGIATREITIQNEIFPVLFGPSPGTYITAPTITLTSQTPGVTIRYTLDHSTPTSTNGTIYTAPLTISESTTIKAVASYPGKTDSIVTTGEYVFITP